MPLLILLAHHHHPFKLRINPGNNIINKICYQNQYISADLHYTQILFEEKKNGSHFE